MEIAGRTVSQLRQIVSERDQLDEEFLQALAKDPRQGVQNLCGELRARQERLALEKERLARLFVWERKVGSPGLTVAGIDEAGRGPLAGPVVAGAVILTPDIFIRGLNDSKKIAPKARENIARDIYRHAIAWSLGWASVEEIDELNIQQASFLAMRRAVQGLAIRPDHLLVDGFIIPDLGIEQTKLVKGDCISASIAAASILAKVSRDNYMIKLHQRFPYYGFDKHKGYPTREHFQALAEYGPSQEHRCTFSGVKNLVKWQSSS